MRSTLTLAAALAALLLAGASARAACGIAAKGQVDVISNSFPVLEHIGKAMESCAGDGLAVSVKLTSKHKEETEQAFTSGTSPFELAQVSTSSFAKLASLGALQPMTDLVVKYRDRFKLEEAMLVTIGDQVYGIAFMVNLQHLFYRKDLLDQHGIATPATYPDVLAAAEKLKGQGGIAYPLGGAFKSGFDLGLEFTNIYLSLGGQFFEPGTAKPAFNGPIGVQTLELMKKLMAYQSPNALSLGTGDVTTAFQQGQIGIANLWASRAQAMDDKAVSKVEGKIEFAAAPAAKAGGRPASTLFWDAFVMPKSMDGDREATFLVLMEGLSEENTKGGNNLANWIRSVFVPDRYSKGVAASARAGAPSFPTQPFFELAHGAIGKNIGDYLAGTESAQASLDDAVAAYTQSAKAAGFLR